MDHTTLEWRAQFCLDWLERNRISLHNRNRIFMQCQALAAPSKPRDSLVDPEDVPLLNHASQDICEISIIFHVLGERLQNDLKSKFDLLVKDVPSEMNMQKNSVGRDTQFELYIAAVCGLAGINTVVNEEGPDILGNLGSRRFFIEAKRVKSEDKIRRATRKAKIQLANADAPAIIALDFTRAYNPSLSSHVRGLSQSEIVSLHEERSAKYDRLAWRELQKSGSACRIGLVLSRHTMLVPEVDRGPKTSGRTIVDAWSSAFLPNNLDGEKQFYQDFNYRFQWGLGRVSSIPPQTP